MSSKESSAEEKLQEFSDIEVAKGRRSTATASGQEQIRRDKEENGDGEEIPEGEDRGSTVEIVGEPEPDIKGKAPKADTSQLQYQPATFVKNGALDLRTVPTPSGPVPISATAATQEEVDEKLEERADSLLQEIKSPIGAYERLTDSQIEQMSSAELRAVASQRGYENAPLAGNRTTRGWFKRQQEDDDQLEGE